MNMKDIEVLRNVQTTRAISEKTFLYYKSAAVQYTKLNKLSLKELIDEAVYEQDNNISWKNQKLKERLIDFRMFLLNNYNIATLDRYLSLIKNIYKTFEITIEELPYFNKKQGNYFEPIGFNDIPSKENIKAAINISDPLMKSVILFMTSGGFGKTETLNMRIKDFINATKDYHDETDIYKVLEVLQKQDKVVPSFRKVRRQKTNRFYYNFCSPEATKAICSYLIKRKKIKNTDEPLFKRNYVYFAQDFQKINDKLKLGKVGPYNKFRPHMLRKFHASNLYENNHTSNDNQNVGLNMDQIDALQGRGKGDTRSVYFMNNPEVLKKAYIRVLPLITIFNEYTDDELEHMVEEKAEKKIVKVSEEFESALSEIRQELNDLKRGHDDDLKKWLK